MNVNEEQIEQWLRNGAALKAPAGLLEQLIADIELPRVSRGQTEWSAPPSRLKRWVPALSFAALFLACLVAIAMQTNMLSGLAHKNESLRTAAQALETLRQDNDEFKRLSAANAELDRLRKDNAELKKLREEVPQLAAQAQTLAILRADNQRLQAESGALSTAGNTNSDFFAEAKAKAERIMCVNNLKQLGLAARIWANDHADIYPPDLISMTNEMSTWKILQCPSDTARQVKSWSDVAAGNVSYQFLTPGIKITENPFTVSFECPIHHNVALLDGSVQMLSPEKYQTELKMIDGRKVYSNSP